MSAFVEALMIWTIVTPGMLLVAAIINAIRESK